MDWFFLALAAPILLAANSITDKIMFNKYKISAIFSLILIRLMSIPFTVLLMVFVNPAFDIFAVFGILHGFVHTGGSLLFNKAMLKEEVSRVSSLFYINPIFITVFAAVLLGEILTPLKYLGIVMLVLSAILISYKRNYNGKIILTSCLILVVSSTIIRSILNVSVKWVSDYTSIYSFIIWSFTGSIIVALLLLTAEGPKKDFMRNIKKFDAFAWKTEIFGNSLNWIATTLFFVAISVSQVSLSGAIPSLQPFFVLLLSFFAPKLLKEENSRQTVLLKLTAVALIFVGTYFMVA